MVNNNFEMETMRIPAQRDSTIAICHAFCHDSKWIARISVHQNTAVAIQEAFTILDNHPVDRFAPIHTELQVNRNWIHLLTISTQGKVLTAPGDSVCHACSALAGIVKKGWLIGLTWSFSVFSFTKRLSQSCNRAHTELNIFMHTHCRDRDAEKRDGSWTYRQFIAAWIRELMSKSQSADPGGRPNSAERRGMSRTWSYQKSSESHGMAGRFCQIGGFPIAIFEWSSRVSRECEQSIAFANQ